MRRPPLTLLSAAVLTASLLPALGATAAAAPAPQAAGTAGAAVPDELLVAFRPGTSAAERDRARGRVGGARAERVVAEGADRVEVERLRLPQGSDRSRAERELEADPAVAYAEPNYLLSTQVTDPRYADGSLWGLYGDASTPANPFGSQAAEAWAAGNTGNRTVYVGVIDEGIQHDHPDLAGQVWSNPFDPVNGVDDDRNGYVDDTHGWDFAGDDRTVYDGGSRGSLDDHGTHVAGTIGAKADGKGVVGVNHSVVMISAKFLGRRGGSLADAVQAVDYLTDLKTRHGLDIVASNNSWGGGGFSQSLLDAITRGARADILFIAAAGNSGSDNDTTASYPANYDTTAGAGYDAVLSVAAIDKDGALASFSQYGARTVDLGAPGVGVLSTTAYSTYSSYNGTSMATPHVTGAAALFQARNPGASALQIRNALLDAARATPTASLTGKTATGGRLNAGGF